MSTKSKMQASYKDGMLEIRMHSTTGVPSKEPHGIEIKRELTLPPRCRLIAPRACEPSPPVGRAPSFQRRDAIVAKTRSRSRP